MKNQFALVSIFICLLFATTAFAQKNDNVLVIIGNDSITKDEFLKTYQKNNKLQNATESDLRDYLDLFVNFRMKVKEGEALQLDTGRQFKMELLSYQKQSSQQYLIDKEVTEQLIQEARTRAKSHVRASHILINCNENANPKDTLAAYNKALDIRGKITSHEISFADAAVKFSDDPSARDMKNPQSGRIHPGNKGDLGYFTVLDLIYPFETAAYNTPVGQISMPVRSRFGYHLVYVVDNIPAIKNIAVAQIFIADTLAKNNVMSDSAYIKIAMIQQQMEAGVPFDTIVAKFSEDKNTAQKGGVMEPFAPNRRPGDFIRALISLDINEISKPIPSNYGWHIVKLMKIENFTMNDDVEYDLRTRIARDERSHKSQASFIAKLKREYNYKENGREKAISFIIKNMPEQFFQSKEVKLDELKGIDKLKPMAVFADKSITAVEFAKYINRFKGMQLKTEEIPSFLQERFDMYVQDNMMRYESDHVLEKYPELRDLVQEFHDGMVLYEINTANVWGKAIQDSVGLQNFYESHQDKYTTDKSLVPTSLDDIRAVVITDYQEYLDKNWLIELRKKYNPRINESVFSTILKTK